jgi:hypothetical protein
MWIWEVVKMFKCVLVRGNGSLGVCLWSVYLWRPVPVSPFCFLAAMRWTAFLPHAPPPWGFFFAMGLESRGPFWPKLKSLKLWVKIKLSSSKLFLLGICHSNKKSDKYTFLPTVCKDSFVSTSSPAFVIFSIFITAILITVRWYPFWWILNISPQRNDKYLKW